MVNLFICFTVFYLISTTLYEEDINSRKIIASDNIHTKKNYPPSNEPDYQYNIQKSGSFYSLEGNLDKDSEKPSFQQIVGSTIRHIIPKKGSHLFINWFYVKGFSGKKDISRKTYFTNKFIDINNKTYNVNCGPWIPDEHTCKIFCEFDESIPKGNYSITFYNITFNYSDNELTILNPDIILLQKEDYITIDIYSDKQVINLTDKQETYDLKYFIKLYNNEKLYFTSYQNFIPANCTQKNSELICTLKKDFFENNLSGNILQLVNFENKFHVDEYPPFSPSIEVNYNNIKKVDIFVGIKKLLTKKSLRNEGIIVYETNVTKIPNIDIYIYLILFNERYNEYINCRFLKGGTKPMLLVCRLFYLLDWDQDFLTIKEYKEEIIFNKTVKYNFRIQPFKLGDIFHISKELVNKIFVYNIYPNVLDFTSKDSYEIEIISYSSTYLRGLTFNEKKEDLICEKNRND